MLLIGLPSALPHSTRKQASERRASGLNHLQKHRLLHLQDFSRTSPGLLQAHICPAALSSPAGKGFIPRCLLSADRRINVMLAMCGSKFSINPQETQHVASPGCVRAPGWGHVAQGAAKASASLETPKGELLSFFLLLS